MRASHHTQLCALATIASASLFASACAAPADGEDSGTLCAVDPNYYACRKPDGGGNNDKPDAGDGRVTGGRDGSCAGFVAPKATHCKDVYDVWVTCTWEFGTNQRDYPDACFLSCSELIRSCHMRKEYSEAESFTCNDVVQWQVKIYCTTE